MCILSTFCSSYLSLKFFFFTLFLVAFGLCCCMCTFSSWGNQALLFVVGCGLLVAVPTLVAGHRLLGVQASVVVVCEFCCPGACGIFPGQGLKPCPLHWQVILNQWTTRKAL